jgi:hypothetical protein
MGLLGQEQVDTMGTIFKTKEVSMKWLKRLIAQWSSEGRELWEEDSLVPMKTSTRSRLAIRSSGDIDSEEGLNITVRKAIGGKIVTFRHYDHKTDRTSHKLYVVPDDLDFDKELGKMITLESMRM